MLKVPTEWAEVLDNYLATESYKNLSNFVENQYNITQVFPPKQQLFSALDLCSPQQTKVVILGQDPYFNQGQAHGLAFSVSKNTALPPSLKNIYLAMEYDLGNKLNNPKNGNLEYLAEQGVLLLNTVMTVEKGLPQSHAKKGWESFTDTIIQVLANDCTPKVFLLWGKPAQNKVPLINKSCNNHLILTAPHPSPLSFFRGFKECKHFSKTNEFLTSNNIKGVDWLNNN